ncbi:MAG: MarR family transcriptional regulator [Rhodoglobus sp.]|nr:MarR family transcriptional regulator [Rhodoglobus sp.]
MPDAAAQGGVDEAIAEVEQQLAVLFGRARLLWKDAAAQVHPELKPVGYKILSTIVRLEETNAYVLADVLETDKSVVSRQVRMLEDARLVVSRADDKDGRARVLSPTPSAVALVRAAQARQQDRLRDLLRSRPANEVRDFAGMLELISAG